MGLTLQFTIGDKERIINTLKNEDLDFFEQLSQDLIADFSYHITPKDLNLLVNTASEVAGISVVGLREHLDTTLFYFDTAEMGAYFVNPIIKTFISKLDEDNAAEIASKWFAKMAMQYGEDMEPEDDVILSIQQLISICKKAETMNLDLVHVWFL